MVVNTITKNFYKSFWQDVHFKAAQEFNAIKGNRLFDGPVAVIFGNESYFLIFYVQDALICNCHPVSVLTQVFYNVLSACHRWFSVYYPLRSVCCLNLVVNEYNLFWLLQGTFKAVEDITFKSLITLMLPYQPIYFNFIHQIHYLFENRLSD